MTQPPTSPAPAAPRRANVDPVVGALAAATHKGAGPPWLVPGLRRWHIDLQWLFVASIMAVAGLAFFGWRAAIEVAVTTGVTVFAYLLVAQLIRRLLHRPPRDPALYALHTGLLAGLCLPVTGSISTPAFAGVTLGILLHVVGRAHRVRLHPIVAALLLTWLLQVAAAAPNPRAAISVARSGPEAVLRPHRIFVGDVLDQPTARTMLPWWAPPQEPGHDALRRAAPLPVLLRETRLTSRLVCHPRMLVQMLVSGELPRLQELLLGCMPGPIGATSQALLILLGLYLMYRRLAWWPMAVVALVAAVGALLLMPVEINDHLGVLAAALGPARFFVSMTFVAYMILASPLALSVLILAPSTAPTSPLGRLIYGAIIGSVMVLAMWMTTMPMAGLLGLLLASAISRPLDALQGYGPGGGH